MKNIFFENNLTRIGNQPSFDYFNNELLYYFRIKIYNDYCILNNKLKKSNIVSDYSILNYLDIIIESFDIIVDILIHPVALLWLNTTINLTNKHDFSVDLSLIEIHFFNIFISSNVKLKQNTNIQCTIPTVFTLLPYCYKFKIANSKNLKQIATNFDLNEILISDNSEDLLCIASFKINEILTIKGAFEEIISPCFVNEISIEYGKTELLNYYGQNFEKIDINSWMERTTASFSFLEKNWPEMYTEISHLIKVIVPASYSFTDVHLSGTDHWTIGTIFTSLVEEPQLSDGIIHEYRHNLLNCLLELKDIFKPNSKQPKIFFSPWRPDPRPEIGVFHAIFVFASVTEYYFRICKNNIPEFDKEEMRFRLILETIRTLIAVNELNSFSELNEFGMNLLKTIHIQINDLYAKLEIKPNERVRVFDYITNEYEIWKDKWKINSQGDIYNFLKSIYIYRNENI